MARSRKSNRSLAGKAPPVAFTPSADITPAPPASAPQQVRAAALHAGDDVIVRHGRQQIPAHIDRLVRGNTGPQGHNFVTAFCHPADGDDFIEALYPDDMVTRTREGMCAELTGTLVLAG